MNNYKQLARIIIIQILKNLNIVRKADSFYYRTKINYSGNEIDREILVTDDEDKIYDLLDLRKIDLDDCVDAVSTFNYFRKGRFFGKDFMEVLKISQTVPYFRPEIRSIWKLCIGENYNGPHKIDEEVLYIKMIDRFCDSFVERTLKREAAASIRTKYINQLFSTVAIAAWTKYKGINEIADLRDRFFDHISTFYTDFNYPVEQYLSEIHLPQARKDLIAFIKNEDLEEYHDAHLST